MDIPKDALTVQHTGTNVTVGSPHLFHALARKLPGVSTQAQAEKIANDVMGVIREYKTLHAVARSFWHENGTEEMCIFIKGLVTTTFKFQSYQTPIKLVISNRYPQDAPQFYVDLEVATNMIVASNHPCIDRNGKVRIFARTLASLVSSSSFCCQTSLCLRSIILTLGCGQTLTATASGWTMKQIQYDVRANLQTPFVSFAAHLFEP
jgi:hypothetical protein